METWIHYTSQGNLAEQGYWIDADQRKHSFKPEFVDGDIRMDTDRYVVPKINAGSLKQHPGSSQHI